MTAWVSSGSIRTSIAAEHDSTVGTYNSVVSEFEATPAEPPDDQPGRGCIYHHNEAACSDRYIDVQKQVDRYFELRQSGEGLRIACYEHTRFSDRRHPRPVIHYGRITLRHPPFSLETFRAKHRARKHAPAMKSPYATLCTNGWAKWERRNWAAGGPLLSMLSTALSAVELLWNEVEDDSASSCDPPGPVDDFEELEPVAEAALRQLKRALGLRRHSAFVARVTKRERRHRRRLMTPRRYPPSCHQREASGDEPPGQVILASPHVTTGPPRPRVAAMRRTGVFI